MEMNHGEIDEAVKEEVFEALEAVVEDGFEDFDVTEVEKWGDKRLNVTLDSLEHHRKVRVEIDDMP